MSDPIDLIDQCAADLRAQSMTTLARVPAHGREAVIGTFLRNYMALAINFLGRDRARELLREIAADLGIPLAARRS